MSITLKLLAAGILVLLLSMTGGCGCGFDCNSDDEDNPARLTLGLSDSLPEDLKQVVIEVDSITFRRNGGSNVVVDTFTFETSEQDFVDAASFPVDLLQHRGVDQLVVISGLEMPTGTYDEVSVKILVDSVERSYVQLENDALRKLNVQNGILTLPGMRLSSGTQRYVIEFGLAQALQYLSDTDEYLLTSTGVRIENTETSATLSGQVDSALFDTGAPCSEKSEPEDGNRIYLYQGVDLVADNLADVFTSASTETIPTNAISPFAVASLVKDNFTGNWEYSVGYVPAGDYTLAFACDTAADDAVNFDDLLIPQPANELREIGLAEGESAVCDIELNGSC
jgi:hypothetical protein